MMDQNGLNGFKKAQKWLIYDKKKIKLSLV